MVLRASDSSSKKINNPKMKKKEKTKTVWLLKSIKVAFANIEHTEETGKKINMHLDFRELHAEEHEM